VGKYVELRDAYKSIYEALQHAAGHHGIKVNVERIDSEVASGAELDIPLSKVDGILIPGGFGARGVEGKIYAANYARKHRIPFLGICLGMQVALIAFAREVCGLPEANSTEFNETTPDPIIDLMASQKAVLDLGGTMRLGAYPCRLMPNTRVAGVYGTSLIHERHRHRYEVNNKYRETLENNGMVVAGVFEETNLVEMVELVDHPWYVGCQFHPEFQSRPLKAHPLFREFVGAVMHQGRGKRQDAASSEADQLARQ
jgi:CTP synthase